MPELTTADVLRVLLAAGWRWDRTERLPVLTNAPEGKALCTSHGGWVETRAMVHGICRTCDNANLKPQAPRRVWWKE